MSVKILDTIEPLGNFPVAKGKDIDVSGKRVNVIVEDYENRISALEDIEATHDYNNLLNKPKIEGVELNGNKTAADLGLAKKSEVPTKTSQLINDSGFTTFSGNYADLSNKPTIPTTKADIGLDAVDNTSDANKPLSNAMRLEISRINEINYEFDNRITALEDSGGGGGETTNYNTLDNKPKINGIELKGNKSASDFGLSTFSGNYADLENKPYIATKTSQLTNDAGFSTFSGSYSDLSDKPAIPAKTSQLLNDSGFTTFSGNYSDLVGKPTIPSTKSDIGLDNVDNTSDANKPVSIATRAEFNKIEAELEDMISSEELDNALRNTITREDIAELF